MKLLRFTADWCYPCKQFAPQFDAAVAELGIDSTVVDIEQQPEIAKLFNIKSIPAVFLLDADNAKSTRLDIGAAAEIVAQVQALQSEQANRG